MAARRSIALLAVMSPVVAGLVALTASTSSAAPVADGPLPGTFRGLTPTRLLDTRISLGGSEPGANGLVQLAVAGHGGVPATGVSAVALNVTATAPTRAGYLTVFPDGSGTPSASTLDFNAGATVANLVVVKVGTNGKVDLLNRSPGHTQLIADVSGYYVDGTATQPGTLTALAPSRILDTRIAQGGTRIAAHAADTVQIAGLGGVPATGVAAAILNVTVTRPAAGGFLTVYAADGSQAPTASNLDFGRGQTVANLVFAPLGGSGQIKVFNGGSGATDVVADVLGYVLGGAVIDAGGFRPLPPTRTLDTRRNLGGQVLAPHATLRLRAIANGGVPTQPAVRAVVLNITATASSHDGFVTVFPDNSPRPTASNLNFVAGATVPNLVIARVDADGYVDLYNGSAGSVQLIADVNGYYLGTFGEPAASCTGFTNTTGITDSTITIANASDLTGPVPGLYQSALQATQAYAAYFNSVADLCGRSLSVEALDSQSSMSGDQQAALTACSDAFAVVGSMATFDAGGASTSSSCGIPDVRARPFSAERYGATDSFAVSYGDMTHVPAAVWTDISALNLDPIKNAAVLSVNEGSYPTEATHDQIGWSDGGYSVVYHASIAVTTFNYTTYVTALMNSHAHYVEFVGPAQYAIKLAQAINAVRSASFSPFLFVNSLTADGSYVTSGGADVDGTFRFTDAPVLTKPGNIELALYEHWLQVVAPGATPTTVGLYAWSAALLFAQQAMALGGRLTRANLVSSLGHVSGWTGNALHAPEAVAAKTPASCVAVDKLVSGTWVRQTTTYFCAPLIATSP